MPATVVTRSGRACTTERPAAGKALPVDALVVMADGSRKPMGDVVAGDRVASTDGRESVVYGVCPQGPRPVHRITFGDGRQIQADEDHLWLVGCKFWDGPRLMTTREIARFRAKASRYANTLHVPMASGELGGAKPLLNPYLLGVLIGDGGLTAWTPTITSMDPEVLERVRQALPRMHWLGETSSTSAGKARTYTVTSAFGMAPGARNVVAAALDRLGLRHKKSCERFVPEVAFTWSRQDRVGLLQGLMDTDGTVDPSGTPTFGSSSLRLVEGVIRLVRSLGGKASLQAPKKTTHLDHHRTGIILPERSEVFHLARKREKCWPHTTHDPRRLRIAAVEPVGEAACQCIAVSHPSRLFLAGDYVVTHNC